MRAIFVILLICFGYSCGKNVPVVYKSLHDFMSKNPDAKLIEMDMSYDDVKASRAYSLGSRQTGDVVVANANKKNSWPQAQNATITLTYPSNGSQQGAFLTYVLINVEQSSNLGRAYVVYGGINQHFIQIIIEAQITNYFNYAAFFYGIK